MTPPWPLRARDGDAPGVGEEDGQTAGSSNSQTGLVVKLVVLAGVALLVLVCLAGSYVHARRLLAGGRPARRGHGWSVKRRASAPRRWPEDSGFRRPASYYTMQMQALDDAGAPPPVYDPCAVQPPRYVVFDAEPASAVESEQLRREKNEIAGAGVAYVIG